MTAYRNRLNAGHYLVGTINTQAEPAAAEAEPEPEPEQPRVGEHEPTVRLDELTKQELLEFAKQLGVSPANNDMTKAELREGIDAHLNAA